MTRLTNLHLNEVRGEDPIPFPTQFCSMIYLQYFSLRNNNFSGFLKNCCAFIFYPSSFTGPIPIDLTRLVGLKSLNLSEERLLEGYFK